MAVSLLNTICITAGHSINNTDDKRVYFNRCFSSTPHQYRNSLPYHIDDVELQQPSNNSKNQVIVRLLSEAGKTQPMHILQTVVSTAYCYACQTFLFPISFYGISCQKIATEQGYSYGATIGHSYWKLCGPPPHPFVSNEPMNTDRPHNQS